MTNQRTYNRSESIVIDGKDFHFTPDRKEFLSTLVEKFPKQTSFTKEDFDSVGGLPYWVKSARYNFKLGRCFNLMQVVNGYNGGYEPQNVTPITPSVQGTPIPAKKGQSVNMPVAAQTTAISHLDNV